MISTIPIIPMSWNCLSAESNESDPNTGRASLSCDLFNTYSNSSISGKQTDSDTLSTYFKEEISDACNVKENTERTYYYNCTGMSERLRAKFEKYTRDIEVCDKPPKPLTRMSKEIIVPRTKLEDNKEEKSCVEDKCESIYSEFTEEAPVTKDLCLLSSNNNYMSLAARFYSYRPILERLDFEYFEVIDDLKPYLARIQKTVNEISPTIPREITTGIVENPINLYNNKEFIQSSWHLKRSGILRKFLFKRRKSLKVSNYDSTVESINPYFTAINYQRQGCDESLLNIDYPTFVKTKTKNNSEVSSINSEQILKPTITLCSSRTGSRTFRNKLRNRFPLSLSYKK
ncbi:uncharacterized protein RJT21DRAFT_141782 [Scheffersomyces amazonensis]|uniref:uncharacterized protein n=1 Tax=Scheffersomyces amazonensis TaxID=1078765 RepID=UPI00315CA47C